MVATHLQFYIHFGRCTGKLKTVNRVGIQLKTINMKKLLVMIFLLSAFQGIAQRTVATQLESPNFPFDCPPGECPVSYIFIEVFNFHKPRTNCESGFGLCIRIASGIACKPCYYKSSITGTKVNAWAKITGGNAELHIPLVLKKQKGFEKTDFSVFEIEAGTVSFVTESGKQYFAKAGKYPVTVVGDEMLVNLKL